MKTLISLFMVTVFAFGWEIIDRASVGMSGNLQAFVKDVYLMQVNHTNRGGVTCGKKNG